MQEKYKDYLEFQEKKKRSEMAMSYVVREWEGIDLDLE